MITEKLIGSVIDGLTEATRPYYYYGSPISVNQMMSKIKNASEKYPAAILFNEFTETKAGVLSLFDRSAELTMYFMDKVGNTWSEVQHITFAVEPLESLVSEFISAIEADPRFGDVDDLETITRTNWGLLVKQQSTERSVFPDFLSGVQINFTLKIKKQFC
jgi:hypothetical protein